MTAIRNLELALMFDNADSVEKAVAALPPAKKELFDHIGKMLGEWKREDS